MNTFVLKGNICWSLDSSRFAIREDSYLVCEDGVCAGVYEELPEKWKACPVYDHSGKLILPGLVDLHIHAPQYTFRSIGMDCELIEWLNANTFREESRYGEIDYAKRAYDIFVDDLRKSATTRVCAFGTIHAKATEYLMRKLEEAGLSGFVGKVNMDRNSPEYLCEESASRSAEDTEQWIRRVQDLKNVRPILTPRFTPSCTDELMERLGGLQKKYGLPMQSHLSENLSEIAWVQELCPDTAFYGEAYAKYGLFGGTCPTIMAHCVHSGEEEIELMKRNHVFIAHCPESNANLSSGIAPVRKYMERGLAVGLGSDIAGGTSLSMFYAMAMAIQCSKLRWRLVDDSLAPLTVEEAFYLATKGGGAFFGKVGGFEAGYEFDAVVYDDRALRSAREFTVRERLERLIYLSDDRHIAAKFVRGREIYSA